METRPQSPRGTFEDFDRCLKALYAKYTFERAAEECQVPIERIEESAKYIAEAGSRIAAHVWRSASIGNLGGWQVPRCLFSLNVLTGSVGTKGGTSLNSWNKFVPKPFKQPPPFNAWQEMHLPHEWPLAHYGMSFLLPHFLNEGRGDIDVYFTRVYNPMWINPDGFMWLEALRDEYKIKCHVALTPTWNESAWFADYVLPMGHAGERHDIMSQETHAGQWIGFRQPVRRVAMERAGEKVKYTYEANPGEVWEEAELWVELSGRMDPDGSLGVRQWFESPERPRRAGSSSASPSWSRDRWCSRPRARGDRCPARWRAATRSARGRELEGGHPRGQAVTGRPEHAVRGADGVGAQGLLVVVLEAIGVVDGGDEIVELGGLVEGRGRPVHLGHGGDVLGVDGGRESQLLAGGDGDGALVGVDARRGDVVGGGEHVAEEAGGIGGDLHPG